MMIPDYTVSSFKGLNTFIKDRKTLAKGVASASLNWLTGRFGDHIALRRGMALLGETRQEAGGKVTGLGVGIKKDGSGIPFYSHGKKVKYYNADLDDTVEIGSDLLGSGQDGLDVWFAPYQHLAGTFMYLGGERMTVYKIPVHNPGSAKDQVVTDYRFGSLRLGKGRAFAGRRRSSDGLKTDDQSFYLSYIDKSTFSQFTQVTGEAIGALGSTVYAGTLATIAAKRTVFLVTIQEAGGETITDNGDGTLTGNQGSTGTINYATGAYSVTFNHLTVGAVTASYYWEDATSGGVLDFSFSTPRTTAGQGDVFLQPGSGPFMASLPFQTVEYALHLLSTWQTTLTRDDTQATNENYRGVGIPYPRAACLTPDGILMIDVSNKADPKVRRIELARLADTAVVPPSLSDALDLSGHAFDYAVAFQWGDYDIICCQDYTNGVKNGYNSVMYVRNVHSRTWDRLEYFVSTLAEYEGTLLAGDSISNNLFTLFSGFDDDGSPIANYWRDGQLNLGTDNLKKVKKMRVRGLIHRDQVIRVSLAYDDSEYVDVFLIEGTGSYVDQGINTPIGSYTIGSKVIGGGGEATAHPFDVTFDIYTDKLQTISAQFEALGIGHAQIDEYTYKDIRDKGRRSLSTKTA